MDRARLRDAAGAAVCPGAGSNRRLPHRKNGGRQPLIRPATPFGLAAAAAAVAFLALFACKLNTNPDQAVALEVDLPDSGRAEVGDTVRPAAHALNALGDSITASIFWSSLDTGTIAVLDSASGVSLARRIGVGRLQARTGSLRSDPQAVTVLAALDSIVAASATRDTVFVTPPDTTVAPDSLSDSLQVRAFSSDSATPSGRRVVYAATTFPASGPLVTFVPNDSVLTDFNGVATARLRLLPGSIPDSVLVSATMRHTSGAAVSGSPVTFVVVFRP